MRLTRRGVIAQRKGGYVWAVYSLAPGVDESVFTTGSFNMTASFGSTPSLMAADGYTVSASGTISLTSAVKTNVSALTAGKYIVSISSSSSTTTTSTQYVYKVTGVTSSGSTFSKTYTVSYERYEVSLSAKGEDTGDRVESTDGTAYPHNGAQGEYYYVLLRGFTTVHVWGVYNVKTSTGYKQTSTTGQTYTVGQSTILYYGDVTFDIETGYYEFTSPSSFKYSEDGIDPLYDNGRPFFYTSKRSRTMYSSYTTVRTSGSNVVFTATKNSYATDSSVVFYSKGTDTGTSVQSIDSNAYPQDGKQDDYWYVYTGTEEIYIDNT